MTRFFLGILFILLGFGVNAQTIKELDVETKAELKSYMKAPADYRTMLKSYTDQIESYEVDLNEVKEDYYKMEFAKKGLKDSIGSLNAKIVALQTQLANQSKDTVYINSTTNNHIVTTPTGVNTINNNTVANNTTSVDVVVPNTNTVESSLANIESDHTSDAKFTENGTDYRVQVGAYKRNEFDSMLNVDMPVGSTDKNGVTSYYVGSWTDPLKAEKFAASLRTQKIKGAFVTKYVDGERVFFDYLEYIK